MSMLGTIISKGVGEDRIFRELQTSYRSKYGFRGAGILSERQLGKGGTITRKYGDKIYTFNGNVTACYIDANGNGKTDEGELRRFTDKHTLGRRDYREFLKVANEDNFRADVIGSIIQASDSEGTVYGKDIDLWAEKGSNIELRAGGNNTAVSSDRGTKVIMRDHDPRSPGKAVKTRQNALARDGGEVIQAAYHKDTVNNGLASDDGTLNQQGARNYATASGRGSFIGQQGSRYQDNRESAAYVYDGATAHQLGDKRRGKLIAYTDDAYLSQVNPYGGVNYAETVGRWDGSSVSQKGSTNIAAGLDAGVVKQVNDGNGFNLVSRGLQRNWRSLGPYGFPHYESYVGSSTMRMHPESTRFFDEFRTEPMSKLVKVLQYIKRALHK